MSLEKSTPFIEISTLSTSGVVYFGILAVIVLELTKLQGVYILSPSGYSNLHFKFLQFPFGQMKSVPVMVRSVSLIGLTGPNEGLSFKICGAA